MAAFSQPRVMTLRADGVVSVGRAVKIGSDSLHAAKSTAATDKHFGIAMNSTAGAEELLEVALPGGGAKGLCQTTVSANDLLTAHTDGALKPASGPTDRVIAMAMEDGVANDLIAVEVLVCFGPAAS